MSIRPPNPTLELLRVYREQLTQKDAQIESLTSLLKEANARLAEQQQISETVLALQVKHSAGTSQVLVRQPPDENGASVATHRAGDNSSGSNAGPILLHQEAVTSAPAHAPISMAYFTPLEGLTPGRKSEEKNERNSPEKIEAEESDEPANAQEWPRVHDPGFRRDASEWRIPVLVSVGLACALVTVGVVWWNSRGARSPNPRLVAALAKIKADRDRRTAESLRLPTSSLLHTPSKPGESVAPVPVAISSPHKAAATVMATKSEYNPILAPAASVPQSKSTLPTLASREAPDPARDPVRAANTPSDEEVVQAVTNQDLRSVEDLLTKGANINASNEHKTPILAIAARHGYLPMVERLIDLGAEINAANDRGWTALMLAVNYNHPSTVRTLLSYKPLPDLRNSQGSTALMLAAQQGNREAVKGLLDIGADPALKNNAGQTARDLADKNGHGDIVKMFGRY